MENKADCEDEGASDREAMTAEVKDNSQAGGTSTDVREGTEASPRRPLTRSQTGRVPKRRHSEDSPSPEPTKKISRVPKKPKAAYDVHAESSKSGASTADEVSVPRPGSDTPTVAMQLGRPDGSTSSTSDTPMERITSKSHTSLPIPVPNLTKKSRGRRVPIRLPNDGNVDPKDTRMYVCQVESCGKCFRRGEHLKRHIRSIHTHEKPFKCTFPLCNKHFNRHDNLLQHLKVHKELATSESSNTDDTRSPIQLGQNTPSPLSVASPPQLQPYYAAHEAYEASMKQARMAAMYQPPTSSYHAYTAPYASLSEPMSFAASMAVSSLRTEIPQSPPSRTHFDQTA
ncbi:putative zinc finger, C2H2 type [Lyophyllum shimeji]|uniref:Zinc finger, C2H2 type n=1 Tax=Lyophyllum shimeji TaxID=47721 RepID=A0A9P3UV12_LYOSH|nr:putative zinc finger, C2H2 type [Lyophyllum shimeji]